MSFFSVDADPGDVPAWAEAAKESLSAAGWRNEDLLIGLASDACLAGSVAWQLRRRPDRRTLTFQLESALPVAAEEIVADFISDRHSAFGA